MDTDSYRQTQTKDTFPLRTFAKDNQPTLRVNQFKLLNLSRTAIMLMRHLFPQAGK